MIYVVAAVGALILGYAGVAVFHRFNVNPHADVLNRYIGRQIVVHDLRGGPSFQGVLVDAYPSTILLRATKNLDDKADLEGEVGLPRAEVWWQVL